jgi:hypothetical protein
MLDALRWFIAASYFGVRSGQQTKGSKRFKTNRFFEEGNSKEALHMHFPSFLLIQLTRTKQNRFDKDCQANLSRIIG